MDNKPTKKNKSKGCGKSKGMQSQTRVQPEKGEETAVKDEQETVVEDEQETVVEDVPEIVVKKEQETVMKEEQENTFNNLSELISQRVSEAINKSLNSHKQLVSDFDEHIETILSECEHTYDAFLLTQMRYEIYNQAARNVAELYENNFYEKHQHFDFNLDAWTNVGKSYVKRYQKSDEEANFFGNIGERLARDYLSNKYNDKVKGHDIRWLNEVSESHGPYDLALFKEKDILHYFEEVKITDIPEKFWFKMTPNEIDLASKSGDFYSVVFLKVRPDYSVDIFEIKNPLSKQSEMQAILRARKEAKGLQCVL
ncbi:hypothetical protein MtrunA17_Chr8g0352961 [Medicago truncatula]|nr:hypothetical protein MtrunA17_Chr8g0352961 [Medicago truncatula]